MIGQSIAHFRITEKLGAGGMGEVYRATDSRLARDVALKIIPEAFASDQQRMARFEREAQLLAALNHPNIAAIYGLELAGTTRALVMELIPGPTLQDRIAQGPMPLEEALPIARQIAEALEYAHERGIIHRDLKPANVKVTGDGNVKLLDFGLAKALEDSPVAGDISNSPTISAAATLAGVVLGTAAYMSPEQAKGKPADRRADIWSYGVVLYEMLSGQPLYTGETTSEVLAAVILKEPALDSLPATVPARVRQLLRRCLTKDPKQRLRDIGEARIAVQEAIAQPASAVSSEPAAPPAGQTLAGLSVRRSGPWAAAAVFFALLAAIGFWHPWSRSAAVLSQAPLRLSAEVGASGSLDTEYGAAAVLSPDGSRLAFAIRDPPGKLQIYLRSLDQLQATPLSGTEGGRNPFFSPDGQWIGFFAGGKLKKISVHGGAAVTLCDAPDDRGGSWSDDNTILFAGAPRAPISRVSSGGGTPEPVTSLVSNTGDLTHRWPQALPGGKAVLFTANTGNYFEDSYLVVQVLGTGEKKIVQRGGFHGRYLPSGHLVFMHGGTLFAMPFDLKRLEATGQPAPVIETVLSRPSNAGAQFSVSNGGLLAYVSGTSPVAGVMPSWITRDGKMEPFLEKLGDYYVPAFSPDGKRLALQVQEGARADIWVYDLQRETFTRLTFAGDANLHPVWTPDGKRITYAMSEKGGNINLYWKAADGSGDAQRLTNAPANQRPGSWSPDGKILAFGQALFSGAGSPHIYTITMEGDDKTGWKAGEPKLFQNSSASEANPAFSPDGRWLAYQSDESGSFEVYVRPFPGPGGRWQISAGGGFGPQWSRNGKEIFYRSGANRIMVATYTATKDTFQASKPATWVEANFSDRGLSINYVLHPDGKRVAVFKKPSDEASEQASKIVFVLNFFDELRRKSPGH